MSVPSLCWGLLSFGSALFFPPRLHLQIGRRLAGKLPADVGFVFQFVIGVRLLDGMVKRRFEGSEVFVLDRLADRRPVLSEKLMQRFLMLRAREGAEFHQFLDLFPLEIRELPVPFLGRVVKLPGALPDLGHNASQPRLNGRNLIYGHLAMAAPYTHLAKHFFDFLFEFLISHDLPPVDKVPRDRDTILKNVENCLGSRVQKSPESGERGEYL